MLIFKPRIKKEEAEKLLCQGGKFLPFRRHVPTRVELVEIPYYFFTLEVSLKTGRTRPFHAALDGILGTFAMVNLEALESEDCDMVFEFCFRLDDDEAKKRISDECRWELYRRALKDREAYEIKKISGATRGYYPYWVGYFERKKKWDFAALDAVTGVLQGGPMRRVFIQAFCEKNGKASETSEDQKADAVT
jgi:hypothetical protein